MDSNSSHNSYKTDTPGPFYGMNGYYGSSSGRSRTGAGFTYVPPSGKTPSLIKRKF